MKRLVCKAILFDLDGVLVDSHAVIERQWQLWADQHGLDVAKIFAIMHGRRTIETIQEIAPSLPVALEAQKLEQLEIEDRSGLVAMAGAADLLATLPVGRWAVVTSGSRMLARTRLLHVGLPLPSILISADEVHHGKPHPEGYLKAASLLDIAPQQCVVIEDAPAGIQAARAAGIPVIAVATSHASEYLQQADICIPSLAALAINKKLSAGSEDIAIEIL